MCCYQSITYTFGYSPYLIQWRPTFRHLFCAGRKSFSCNLNLYTRKKSQKILPSIRHVVEDFHCGKVPPFCTGSALFYLDLSKIGRVVKCNACTRWTGVGVPRKCICNISQSTIFTNGTCPSCKILQYSDCEHSSALNWNTTQRHFLWRLSTANCEI